MRALLLTPVLGLSLVACTVGDTGGGGGDDVAATCGNGTIDPNETCDDRNTADGDGCSSSCQTEATPRLDVTVDKSSVTTELGSKNMLTLTLTSSGGFAGSVGLAGSVVDAANAAIPGWTVTFASPSVDVPADGTANAVAELDIASNATVLTGTLNFQVTGAPTAPTVPPVAVTAMNQVTLTIDLNNNGECVYPASGAAQAIPIKIGTTVRFFNKSQVGPIVIHSNDTDAIPHQGQGAGSDDPATEPQTAYTRVLQASSRGIVNWYCHSPGPDLQGNNPIINVQ